MSGNKIVQYISVVAYPVIASVAVTLLWKFALYDNGVYFSPDAETAILYIILPPVGFIYVIFASLAVNAVFEKHKQIKRSVTRKDIDTYLEHRDQSLPALMHILVAMPSAVLLFVVLTYYYADLYSGIATVFLVTFVISITWIVINELDNSHKRTHFKATLPSHWHTKKTEDHFKETTKQ